MERARRSNTEEDGGAADTRTQQLLDRKNREIADLRQKLEESKKQNDLEVEEIARLEKKIKTLEDEMRLLEKKTKEESQEFNQKLQKLEDDLKTTNENNDKLKMQVEQLSHDQRASEQQKALIHLRELCRQLQGSVYKMVMPEVYVSWRSYKVKAIEHVIQNTLATNKRDKAKKIWQKIKIDLNWNEDFEEVVEELQKGRNDVVHPASLDEAALRDYVNVLDQQGCLTAEPFTKQRMNEIIDMWKRFKEDEC